MLGIQIYTVRELTKTQAEADKTVAELKRIGYGFIQLAGDVSSISRDAAAARKCGMPVIGMLTDISTCKEHGGELIDIAKQTGARDIGISGSARSESEARTLANEANAFAREVRESDLSFSYHNHSHEFLRTECSRTVMDILLEGFDKELVDLMPDIYWLQHGGVDVRDFIERYAERIKLLHLKDMKRVADGVTFAEVGCGNLNMRGIISTAINVGIRNFIVEQDICDKNPLISAKASFENAKELLGDF